MARRTGPFLKWAGGKGRLLEDILPRLPERIDCYYEPFVGGGAVFFALAREGRFERAVLGDRNPNLVSTYRVVRDQVEELIEALEPMVAWGTDPERYYEVRAWNPDELDEVTRAARFVFLNKTCFNGLYRVNRSGRFNVPFGRYKRPKVLDADALRRASAALSRAEVALMDFEDTVREAGHGDAVYFDPPYVPISTTSSFTAYHDIPFGPSEHARLRQAYRACCRRGASAVLSNSDTEATRKLYRGFRVVEVQAQRAINCQPDRRGSVSELLVVGLQRRSKAVESPTRRRSAAG